MHGGNFMARPIPFDTYMVNIDETETVFPNAREEQIMNRRKKI